MKYFVISDIHAHYQALQTALKTNGYDSTNPTHHLLILGDLFDRGKDSKQVLEYLYPLHQDGKVTIILGNHDSYLRDFLLRKFEKAEFNIFHNGFGETLVALSGYAPVAENFNAIYDKIHKDYPYLLSWLDSFPLYLEIDDYIFVHGGIDAGMLDWRTMMTEHDFMWKREINCDPVPGKTVVAGHHRVATIRQRTHNYELLYYHQPELFDILYEEGKILIDRFVEVSNELNVLILELKT